MGGVKEALLWLFPIAVLITLTIRRHPMNKINRRKFLQSSSTLLAAGALPGFVLSAKSAFAADGDTVKLGLLHSLTGTIALAEASLVDAEKLAIDEINAAGGVMGRKIEPIIEDGASDWPTFAEKT